MDKILFTKITAEKPSRLTKLMRLDEGGNLVKVAGGPLVEGLAEVEVVANIEGLAEAVKSLSTSQALVYGVTEHGLCRIVSKARLKKALENKNGGPPVVARTRESFSWPEGPGVLLLDFDEVKLESPEEVFNLLAEICPALDGAPMMVVPSASSCIYRGEERLRGAVGWRALIPVQEARDVPRAGEALFQRSWLKGRGFIKVSKSGAQLVRGPLDASVWSPERLDFVGGAATETPLEQRRPDPVLFNPDAEPFDAALIESLSAGEKIEFENLIRKAKAATADESRIARDTWVEARVESELAKKPSATDAERDSILRLFKRAAENQVLHADFPLVGLDGKEIAVGTVLEDREKWHGRYVKDPLEPEGKNSRAKLWLLNVGRPRIHSFYRGTSFYLSRQRRAVEVLAGGRRENVDSLLRIVAEEGVIFGRGSQVVSVSDENEVVPLSVLDVQFHLDGAVRFEKYDGRRDKVVPCDCSRSLADGFVAAAKLESGLPQLAGVVDHPTMDAKTGRIMSRDGYDRQTGILLRLSEEFPGVPDRPTGAQVFSAAWSLLGYFDTFDFCAYTDRGVFLSALLTAIVRPSLETAPLYMVDAPAAGTGKTLLVRCIARLIGLKNPAAFPGGATTEEEVRKRLLAIFSQGARLVLWDNLTGVLSSESLCAALTFPVFEDRILGQSTIAKAPTNSLFFATGNNIRPGGDLCRRSLRVGLDAGVENPWTRKFDRNPLAEIERDRPKLIAAALTVLRGGFLSDVALPYSLGSFRQWDESVRKAVLHLAELGFPVADPAASVTECLDLDPETGKLSTLLELWASRFPSPGTVADAIGIAETDREFRDCLTEIAGERSGGINPRRLGRWIENKRGRIVEGRRFVSSGKRKTVMLWSVSRK